MTSHKMLITLLAAMAVCPAGNYLEAQETNNSSMQVSPDLKEITWLGFQQLADSSRVFVRTNEAVNYRLTTGANHQLVLNIYNSYIASAIFKKSLDTQYFDSPVLEVHPEIFEDITPSVQIVITLRDDVPYEVVQEDNLVYIDFHR